MTTLRIVRDRKRHLSARSEDVQSLSGELFRQLGPSPLNRLQPIQHDRDRDLWRIANGRRDQESAPVGGCGVAGEYHGPWYRRRLWRRQGRGLHWLEGVAGARRR